MPAPRVRVHEVSKVLGLSNAEVIEILKTEFKIPVKSHSSTIDQETADKIISSLKGKANKPADAAKAAVPDKKKESLTSPDPSVNTKEKVVENAVQRQQGVAPKSHVEPGTKPKSVSSPDKPNAQVSKPVSSSKGSVSPSTPKVSPAPVKKTALSFNLLNKSPEAPKPPVKRTALTPLKDTTRQPFRGEVSGNVPLKGKESLSSKGGFNPSATPSREPRRQFNDPPKRSVSEERGRDFSRPRPVAQQQLPSRPFQNSYKPPQTPSRPSSRHSSKASRQAQQRRQKEEQEIISEELPKIISITEPIAVRDLAEKLRLKDTEVIKHLFMKGMMVTVNQILDLDFAKTVAAEFEFEVTEVKETKFEGEYSHLNESASKKLSAEQYDNLTGRSPVISIMGHVDHGKTTLLDSIRETRHKVVDTESGGITQSIGAYCVEKNGSRIVFLDTPGHEAFTAMRMRGAQSTDIAVLVVAADDGIMPQTVEAINHAKVAKIPIIIAVNKIDKDDADPDKVLTQLSEYGLSSEKWGGDTLTVEVSALHKTGIEELLDAILLVTELLELKSDATVPASGIIIEAQLDKRTGPIASILVQNGTLKVGDNILIGAVSGRVRALVNDFGKRVNSAGPATPVEVLGLNGVPNAGETFEVIRDDKQFKRRLSYYKQQEREERIGVTRSVTAGFSGKSEIESDNDVQESQFNLLVKSDSQGSLEAVVDVLQQMTNNEVKINIVHSATGDISEADVMLASTAQALIIGFNSKPDNNAQRLAENESVSIRQYDVIYHIAEDIEKWVLGQLSPETQEVHSGTAEVRQTFTVGKSGVIAGCMVTKGKVVKNSKAVVLRNEKELYTGALSNLKRFKDDVKEVALGYECGISFERFQDLKEGDIIEVYVTKSLERTSF